jgi:hypothetical protein
MRRNIYLLALAATLLLPNRSRAQFAVFDATNFAQFAKYYQLAMEMKAELKGLPAEYRYVLLSQWASYVPHPSCVGCGVIANAANTGTVPADPTYGGGVTRLLDYGPLLAMLPADGQQRLQAELATRIYLPQANLNNSLSAVGTARTNDPTMQEYIQQCQSDVLNPAYVSDIQTKQAGNACLPILLQQQALSNNLSGRLLEHAAIAEARQIDAETRILNRRIAKATLANSMAEKTAGIDAALANWGHN